jgi:plasmid stabilization system protein ParE
MRLPVRLLPEARAEFDDGADWYEARRAGLGTEFVAEVRAAIKRTSANPLMHATVYKDIRKAVVRRFPYVILYRADPTEILVVAVFHTSRDPHDWMVRV